MIDLERVWLVARVFEPDIPKVEGGRSAWFAIEGYAQPFTIDETNATLVTVGRVEQPLPVGEARDVVCQCVGELAATLKPEYAEALRRIEIDGVPVKDYAHEVASPSATPASGCSAPAKRYGSRSRRRAAHAQCTDASTVRAGDRRRISSTKITNASGRALSGALERHHPPRAFQEWPADALLGAFLTLPDRAP